MPKVIFYLVSGLFNFLSHDNGTRSASFFSSKFFLLLILYKVGLFCFNNQWQP